MSDKYMAYFDLLGTKNVASSEDYYFESINIFRKRLIDNITYLQMDKNLYNVSFFSDCCYVESKKLSYLLLYLENLRNDLIAKHLFFNAAVIKAEYTDCFSSFESTERGGNDKRIVGTLFRDSIISDVYNAQSRFKGIGVWIEPRIIQEDILVDEKLRGIITDSFYMDEITQSMHISKYYDIRMNLHNSPIEKDCLNSIIKSYFFACCETPRAGRYYSSLMITIINSDDSDIHWNIKQKCFENTSYVIELVYKILRDPLQYKILTGFVYVAFAFINKIYNSKLDNVAKADITNMFLEEGSIGNSFLTDLNHIPIDVLKSDKTDNVNLFKDYCRRFILSNKVFKYTSHD